MSLRINLKQGEILELTNINTNETIKVKCVASTPMCCVGCYFMLFNDICSIMNCNGNYRDDKTFVKFELWNILN